MYSYILLIRVVYIAQLSYFLVAFDFSHAPFLQTRHSKAHYRYFVDGSCLWGHLMDIHDATQGGELSSHGARLLRGVCRVYIRCDVGSHIR